MKRRFIRYLLLGILPVIALFFFTGCSKHKSTPDVTLAVTTTPASGSTQAPAVGPDFNLNVTITSTMPPKGVTITIGAFPDGNSTKYFTTTLTSTKSSNDFVITNTPVGVVCNVTITVTSLTSSTNTWSGSYRYSSK